MAHWVPVTSCPRWGQIDRGIYEALHPRSVYPATLHRDTMEAIKADLDKPPSPRFLLDTRSCRCRIWMTIRTRVRFLLGFPEAMRARQMESGKILRDLALYFKDA
jgi:hypothetical protein